MTRKISRGTKEEAKAITHTLNNNCSLLSLSPPPSHLFSLSSSLSLSASLQHFLPPRRNPWPPNLSRLPQVSTTHAPTAILIIQQQARDRGNIHPSVRPAMANLLYAVGGGKPLAALLTAALLSVLLRFLSGSGSEPAMADVYSSELTPLQKHVAFFDRNKDGVIYPSETYQGASHDHPISILSFYSVQKSCEKRLEQFVLDCRKK